MTSTGAELQTLRQASKLSQEQLAEMLDVSVRHLSFIENGKTTPSRELVLLIANVMNLDNQTRNSLLRGWSYSTPVRPLNVEELPADLRQGIERALSINLPVLATSSTGDIIAYNSATQALLSLVFESNIPQHLNLYSLVLAPEFKRVSDNWDELVSAVADHVRDELGLLASGSPESQALEAQLILLDTYTQPHSRTLKKGLPEFEFKITLHGKTMHFISMPTTLGTPYDNTGQSIRIETFYPQ